MKKKRLENDLRKMTRDELAWAVADLRTKLEKKDTESKAKDSEVARALTLSVNTNQELLDRKETFEALMVEYLKLKEEVGGMRSEAQRREDIGLVLAMAYVETDDGRTIQEKVGHIITASAKAGVNLSDLGNGLNEVLARAYALTVPGVTTSVIKEAMRNDN